MFYSIVFMQGDDAAEPLDILNSEGADAAVEYLAQWDYGDETLEAARINGHTYSQIADAIGTGDYRLTIGAYVLTWNAGLNYVGLLGTVPAAS